MIVARGGGRYATDELSKEVEEGEDGLLSDENDSRTSNGVAEDGGSGDP
jgi:hypothetical protein